MIQLQRKGEKKEKSGRIMSEFSLSELNSGIVICRLKTTPSESACKNRKRKLEFESEVTGTFVRDEILKFQNWKTRFKLLRQKLPRCLPSLLSYT